MRREQVKYHEIAEERRLYHLAGHVAVAYSCDVSIETVMVNSSLSLHHGVRFASLTTEMHLMSGASAKLDLLHRHLLTRLAGNVAEMIYTIQRFRALGHEVNCTRWRARWLRNLYRRSEADNDWGYAAIISWSDSKNAAEVCASLESLWKQCEKILRHPACWKQVQLLVEVRRRRPRMSGKEAFTVIRPLAP